MLQFIYGFKRIGSRSRKMSWLLSHESPETFRILVNIVETNIRKKYTNFRQTVSVEERLLITLR